MVGGYLRDVYFKLGFCIILVGLLFSAFSIQVANEPVQKPIFCQKIPVTPLSIIAIGNHSTSDYCPLDEYDQNALTQSLYYRNQICTAGIITRIALYCYSTGSNTFDKEVSIYLDPVTITTISSTQTYINKVFTRTSFTCSPSSTGYWWITLDTPYYFDNVKNLLVTVVTRQSSNNYFNYAMWDLASTSGNRYWMGYSDSGFPPTNMAAYHDLPRLSIDISPAVQVSVSAPTGGEEWKGGSIQTIGWNIVGGTGPFSIWANYSLTGASPWTVISTIQAATQASTGTGTGTWTLPVANSTTCKVNVDVLDSAMHKGTATSPAITIDSAAPVVSSTTPANGATNVLTTAQIIVQFGEPMDQTATPTAFSISPDPTGWSWTWNTAGDTMTGSHSNPFSGLTNYTATISTVAADKPGNTMAAPYVWTFETCTAPKVFVMSPAGGEKWLIGSTQVVQWVVSGGTLPYLIWANYSEDSGSTWTPIASAQGITQAAIGSNSASWKLPNLPSKVCYVKVAVTDNLKQQVSSKSNSTFEIDTPTIYVLTPNGGESLMAGSNYDITWATITDKTHTTITLTYSTSGTTGPFLSIASGLPDTGTYTWTVSNTPSTNCYVNATLSYNATSPVFTISDLSNASFTIMSGPLAITVKTPNGGENWTVGTSQNITWSATGGTGGNTVDVDYSIDGMATWTNIAKTVHTGYFVWSIPMTITHTQTNCFVRATAKDSATPPVVVNDTSDSSFTIYVPPAKPIILTFISPVGGENWTAGSTHMIKWTMTGGDPPISSVQLSYSTIGKGGPWKTIGTPVSGTFYNWTTPALTSTAGDCYVSAYVTDMYLALNQSDPGSFTIWAPPMPVITLVSPIGNENWVVGKIYQIKWTTSGGIAPMTVSLEYTSQGVSGTYSPITTTNVPAQTDVFNWTIPDTPSTTCYVHAVITDSYGSPGRTSDTTNTIAFTISESVTAFAVQIIAPAVGDNVQFGNDYTIKWNRSGGTEPFTTKLDYSTDGGSSYISIDTNAADDGGSSNYSWLVPDTPSTNCYIRVNVTDNIGKSTENISGKFSISENVVGNGIDGYVELDTGDPAENVSVTVAGTSLQASSQKNGYFIINNVPAGTHSISFTLDGYQTKTVSVDVNTTGVVSVGIIKLDKNPMSSDFALIVGIIVIIAIAIILLLLFLMMARRKREEEEKKNRRNAFIHHTMVPHQPMYPMQAQGAHGPGGYMAPPPRGSGSLPPERPPIEAVAAVGAAGAVAAPEHADETVPTPEESTEPIPDGVPTEGGKPEVAHVVEETPPTTGVTPEPTKVEGGTLEEASPPIVEETDIVAAAMAHAAKGPETTKAPASTGESEHFEMDVETLNKLHKLDDLKAQGVIDEEQYQANKDRLLKHK